MRDSSTPREQPHDKYWCLLYPSETMRRRHYSIRTERSYCQWVKRFILHFNMKSRNDLIEGEKKIETYLTFLARDRNVAASTQNQALNALVFFYRHVLKQPLNEKINAERAAKKVRIPVVLTRDETKRIIGAMTGIHLPLPNGTDNLLKKLRDS